MTNADSRTTVVIPSWNSLEYLPRCLDALAATAPDTPIVVVDNGSEDGTTAWIRAHAPQVHLIANASNEGFGAACNRGADAATTPWVCFLNADAFVEPGWLAALHQQIAATPRAGIAVPMYLNMDGTLQEAGGLLTADGNGVLHGFGDNPDRLRYRFPRLVDYGSAACLLIERATFAKLNGFDVATYGLAYYEDADLCLRAAASDIFTVYAPAARVVHARNVSSSAEAINHLLNRNRDLFTKHWRHLLDRRPSAEAMDQERHLPIFARDADRFPRVLVLARDVPSPENESGQALLHVVDQIPGGRITIAADSPASEELAMRWCAAGLEIGDHLDDWYGWIRDRVAFYDVAIALDEQGYNRFGAIVELTQSQCARFVVPGSTGAGRWRPFHRVQHPTLLSAPPRQPWHAVTLASLAEAIAGTLPAERGNPAPDALPID
ncbi:MAG: glycosyltransferase family 2 protein [Acidimicrobiia bacterium]